MSDDHPHTDSAPDSRAPARAFEGAFSFEPVVGAVLWIHDLDDQEKRGNVIYSAPTKIYS